MTNTVYIKTYTAPPWDEKEILRYAGVRDNLPEIAVLLQNCQKEADEKLVYKICYSEFPVIHSGDSLDIGFLKTDSTGLRKNLENCHRIVLFAATVGIELDRMIAKYSRLSPTKAWMLQAIGAERIESLCDTFCNEIRERESKNGFVTKPRFSPGYGDFPLETQKDIFRVLDCPKKIGLSLTESLFMSPSKSVTAILGIGNVEWEDAADCKACSQKGCDYRRTV